MDRCDVAIVGAGPYGLAAAAHLMQVPGLNVRLFGEPMSFWERHMPERMLLRSPWEASHIADPDNRFTLDTYRTLDGRGHLRQPLAVRDFIRYGHWFHQQVALAADPTKIMLIEPVAEGYRLTLENGNAAFARRVIVAGGIQPFAQRPTIFQGVPRSLATHTSEQRNFDEFRDKDVVVVGAGQSALEAAGLLHEAGARVEVLVRRRSLHWLGQRQWMHSNAIGWMLYGKGDVGPAGVSLIVQRPNLFRRLPRWIQTWWGRRAIRPAVLQELMPRMAGVPIQMQRCPVQATVQGERLQLRLDDGTDRVVDHVVLGTGYRVDIAKYPFLSPALLERIAVVNGHPRLDAGFETTSPGLHVLGAPAAWSFGPLMRFVAGTEFTARALGRCIATAKHRSFVSYGTANNSTSSFEQGTSYAQRVRGSR
jgi:cation diffusion facilitator CzcD-associated flavoprotein CzcO